MFLLQTDFGQYDEARTFEIGVFSTYEKVMAAKKDIEDNIKKCKQIKIGRKTSDEDNFRYYNAIDFNFTSITAFNLDEYKKSPTNK